MIFRFELVEALLARITGIWWDWLNTTSAWLPNRQLAGKELLDINRVIALADTAWIPESAGLGWDPD